MRYYRGRKKFRRYWYRFSTVIFFCTCLRPHIAAVQQIFKISEHCARVVARRAAQDRTRIGQRIIWYIII